MARNGSGTYSKVNTFVAGNSITASGHNQNWDDLVAEMTNSVAADGQTPITGTLKGANGTAALPSYTFTSDPNTGVYRHGADELGFTTGGTVAAHFDSAQKFWPAGIVDMSLSTSHAVLPTGTTAQRPGSPAAGMFRYNSDNANPEFYSSSWLPLLTSLSGAQLPYGTIVNGTIAESHTGNAVTFALKTLAGTDPSATDPVLIAFRNATVATGNYVYRTVTAALSLVISSGSTMGFTSGVAGRLWLVLFDDAGTIRIGAINCLSGSNIYPLGQVPLASSTAEGGAGAADSAQVFYTGTAVTTKAYAILGYASYEGTGLATAGSWAASPTRLQLFGAGVPLPGQQIQFQITQTGAVNQGNGTWTYSDAIPQNTYGDEYMTRAFTPTSAANVLDIESNALVTNNNSPDTYGALFQDSTANALASSAVSSTGLSNETAMHIRWRMQSSTTSSTTFKFRAAGTAGTTTFNGAATVRKFGGTYNSYMSVAEIMA